ncbi:PAS domain S-box protein [Chromobacterium haemolyticum]|nr:PAS domain S-box protein [Chromobacterium haemolyticum]
MPPASLMMCVISYVPDKQYGQVQGFYAFITDVTLLRIAQDAVLEAQQHLQSVIDAASEFAIITTGLDGTIQMFSTGAERMLGYRAEELVGKQTLLLLHVEDEINDYGRTFPEAVLGFEALVHKVKQEGMDSQEWHYRRKTGDLVPVNLVVTAIHNLAGEISGFLGVARDIREQRLAQHTLRQAREQAEAANRAKSEFVANMSHEIRTPMNAVLGMCHLLGSTPLNAEQNKYLEMLRASGQSLLGILNDILDFSKIEAGKLSLAPTPFVLEESMNALASMMSVTLGDKPLELAIGVEPETPLRLIGDPLRLQQILVNLTGNAIKFTEHGEVVVSILCLNKDASAATLRFFQYGIPALDCLRSNARAYLRHSSKRMAPQPGGLVELA